MGKAQRNRNAAQRKLEEIRRQQRKRANRTRILVGVGAALVVAAVGTAVALAASGGGNGSKSQHTAASGPIGPEGITLETGPALAPASTAATGQTINGIACNPQEQAVYHIHAHLAAYVNGAARQIPLGIGAVEPVASPTANGPFASATHCFYWLHTHASDGIIHIESPIQRTYTLGDFFAIWQQPLNSHQAGTATGPVTAFVNGARYGGDPRSIPLTSRAVIQLDVGQVVPPNSVNWARSQL